MLTNQSITVFHTDGEAEPIILGDALTFFELRYPVHNESGERIHVTAEDEFGNELYNSIYVYQRMLSTPSYVYGSDDRTTMVTKDATQLISIPLKLESGSYILPINGTLSANLDSVKMYYKQEDRTEKIVDVPVYSRPYQGAIAYRSNASDGVYYYRLDIPNDYLREDEDDPTYSPLLTFEWNRQPKENVVLEDVYRYAPNEAFGDSFDEIHQLYKI